MASLLQLEERRSFKIVVGYQRTSMPNNSDWIIPENVLRLCHLFWTGVSFALFPAPTPSPLPSTSNKKWVESNILMVGDAESEQTNQRSNELMRKIDNRRHHLIIVNRIGLKTDCKRHEKAIESADAFVLAFSLNSKESLLNLKSIRQEIWRIKERRDVPIVVVGNQYPIQRFKRGVPRDDVEALAKKWSYPVFETAVREIMWCDECFIALAERVNE